MSWEPDESGFHFDFGVFGRMKTHKIASKKSVEKLMEHLGGFEFWPDLIDDCKEHVAKFLDYKTLTKLGMCSKSDNAIVEKIPIDVFSISIRENKRYRFWEEFGEFENVAVKVQFDEEIRLGNSEKSFERFFSQSGSDTQVVCMQYLPEKRPEKRRLVIENSNYYEEAVKYAEQWMERCQFKLKYITVEMSKYPMETSKIKYLPNCTIVRIGADTLESFRWWIDKVPRQLESVEFVTLKESRETFTLPSEILNAPQIMEAKNLSFWARAAFTDEQFLKLKAEQISFDAVNITDDGVNEFLKKWVNGKGIDEFEQVFLWSTRTVDQQRVMRGLQVRPWVDDFEREASDFCGLFLKSGGRFQISSIVEPLESLTLEFSDDRISIYATGKKVVLGRIAYTEYRFPMIYPL